MNAADLARLELAKRAYRAIEPSAAEVQRGVRKTRLGLQRPRTRGSWLTKTIVACVLAMGGLAYAKPQALGELVHAARRAAPNAPSKHGNGTGLAAAPAALPPQGASGNGLPAEAKPAAPPAQPAPGPVAAEPARVSRTASAPQVALAPQAARADAAAPASNAPPSPRKHATSSGSFSGASARKATQPPQVTDWGRVGSALASGDETRALAVLNELAASEDRRTRDKADLGRAQLMMSNGNRDQACATARSLTNRGAGSRIERQAQVLLKSCHR